MHFLRKAESEKWLVRYCPLRAVVTVKVVDTRRLEVVPGEIGFTKGGAFVKLPPDVEVVSGAGEVLEPTWGFWVSVETFDPFHLVTDWGGSERGW